MWGEDFFSLHTSPSVIVWKESSVSEHHAGRPRQHIGFHLVLAYISVLSSFRKAIPFSSHSFPLEALPSFRTCPILTTVNCPDGCIPEVWGRLLRQLNVTNYARTRSVPLGVLTGTPKTVRALDSVLHSFLSTGRETVHT